MHESGLVAELLGRAEEAVAGDTRTIAALKLQVGPIAGIRPSLLRAGVEDGARFRWGFTPRVLVEASEPLSGRKASAVSLTAVIVRDL